MCPCVEVDSGYRLLLRRKYEHGQMLCNMFLPARQRAVHMVLRAFNVETARVADQVDPPPPPPRPRPPRTHAYLREQFSHVHISTWRMLHASMQTLVSREPDLPRFVHICYGGARAHPACALAG
jgi:hypothetical protein